MNESTLISTLEFELERLIVGLHERHVGLGSFFTSSSIARLLEARAANLLEARLDTDILRDGGHPGVEYFFLESAQHRYHLGFVRHCSCFGRGDEETQRVRTRSFKSRSSPRWPLRGALSVSWVFRRFSFSETEAEFPEAGARWADGSVVGGAW